MKQTMGVAIIGGGIIGSAIAYFLSKAVVRVAIIEREALAVEASSGGHGADGLELSAITGRTIAELITSGNVPALVQP
jgi:glycine/D-amino acid oxidase-like deaminating enzyme